jgi:hypothetical protein
VHSGPILSIPVHVPLPQHFRPANGLQRRIQQLAETATPVLGGLLDAVRDPAIVKEMVTVAHNDAKRVRELLEQHPSLANASVDWGFGDWEDALGAAAHTGRREIAEVCWLTVRGSRSFPRPCWGNSMS